MKDFFKKYKQQIIYGFAGIGGLAIILLVFSIFNVWRMGGAFRSVPMMTKNLTDDYAVSSPAPSFFAAPMMEFGGGGVVSRDSLVQKSPVVDRKIIRTAYLSLLVNKAEEAIKQITSLAENFGGYVENSSLSDSGDIIIYDRQGGASSKPNKQGNVTIRVPSIKYKDAISSIKALAIKVESETGDTRDVSSEFVDLEAQLKNLRAEEEQYQGIMKRAIKIEDVLNVASKLSDVRGRIERMHAQINLMSKQIDMSTISVNLRSEADLESVGVSWRPLSVAKQALQDMLSSLTKYIDGAIVFVINIPVLLLTIITWILWALVWGVGLYIVWRIFKYLKGRFIDQNN